MTSDPAQRLVWDWSVRLFHWLIVLIVPLMWWTAEEGWMDWHRRLGVTMVGLVVFRLSWGLLGTWTARFLPMIRRLGSVGTYTGELRRRQHKPTFGHNPIGVLSVFAMLTTLLLQVSTGLFAVDVDGLESGPLAVFVSFDTGRELAEWHEFNFDVLATFITLHVAAIVTYQFILKDNIVRPMVSGRRNSSDFAADTTQDITMRPVRFLLAVSIAAACVFAILNAG
ncbi:cytochrome b/b6 domain-containing protein [Parasphingorhabdus sp.]|uniref:cytochrome b/b6 domain-containing protein n=1 Tax=Parasphingorhabdus sp. TaxID=2709688 RepID=UPI003263E2DC